MSAREPLWFCHECGAEARPLMAPQPICASCHGSFVERMDDPTDDPREFSQPDPEGDAYMSLLARLLEGSGRPASPRRREQRDDQTLPTLPRVFTFSGSPSRTPTLSVGRSSDVPNMSDFIRRGPDANHQPGGISGALLAQYMMSMLGLAPGGGAGLNEMFARGFGADSGRMGDYVFNQEALDEIITQLMENSNSHRPVAATEEIMDKLPREVLELGSATLQKDCAVCKEHFSVESEDPEEQVVVTLPCEHTFHQTCILPWLKSSGTCPVCRHQLVPQPEYHGPGGDSSGQGQSSSPLPRSPGESSTQPSPNLMRTLFGRSSDSSPFGRSGQEPSSSSRQNRSNMDNLRDHIPGGWDDLD